MKNKLNKLTALFVSFILCFTVIPFLAAAVDTQTEGYYTYTVSNGEATIIRVDSSIFGVVTIPPLLGGYPVTTIGNSAFSFCRELSAVIISANVTTIETAAFVACSNLTYVNIPNSVAYIGDTAFGACSKLCSINIPSSVTYIGQSAFEDCTGLKSITVPNSVTYIGHYAFGECTNLNEITLPFVGNTPNGKSNNHFGYIFGAQSYSENNHYIPQSLKKITITDSNLIPDYAFWGCSNIESIALTNSVISIGESSFRHCSNIVDISIPNSIISIGLTAFGNCSNLQNISIPGSIKHIETGAFLNCDNLKNINILYGVEEIYPLSFSGCDNLENVYIPESVTYISDNAFSSYDFTMHCVEGSEAERFALENNINIQYIPKLPGDVNRDGEVNILDLIRLKKISVGTDTENNSSDLNSDGTINSLDIAILRKTLIGL